MSDEPNLRNLMETWQRVQEQLNQAKDALGDKQVEAETGGGWSAAWSTAAAKCCPSPSSRRSWLEPTRR